MKKLLFLSVLFSQSLFAQTVVDPNGLLSQIDAFVSARDFSKEFIVGDMIEVTESECTIETDQTGDTSYYCDEFLEEKSVVEVGQNWAVMNDGYALIEDLYERYDRNPVRYFLREKAAIMKSLAPETLTTTSFEYHFVKLTPTSHLGLEAIRLDLSIVFLDSEGNEFKIPMFLTIAKDLPFIGQVAEAGIEMEVNGEILPPGYSVSGFIKHY